MGMYDDIRVLIPLPNFPAGLERSFQTKSLNNVLDQYEIREDGTLWVEEFDIEDHSDPNATGIHRIFGMFTRVNERWVPVPDFTGEIEFYAWSDKYRLTYSAYFVDGKLNQVHYIDDSRRLPRRG